MVGDVCDGVDFRRGLGFPFNALLIFARCSLVSLTPSFACLIFSRCSSDMIFPFCANPIFILTDRGLGLPFVVPPFLILSWALSQALPHAKLVSLLFVLSSSKFLA